MRPRSSPEATNVFCRLAAAARTRGRRWLKHNSSARPSHNERTTRSTPGASELDTRNPPHAGEQQQPAPPPAGKRRKTTRLGADPGLPAHVSTWTDDAVATTSRPAASASTRKAMPETRSVATSASHSNFNSVATAAPLTTRTRPSPEPTNKKSPVASNTSASAVVPSFKRCNVAPVVTSKTRSTPRAFAATSNSCRRGEKTAAVNATESLRTSRVSPESMSHTRSEQSSERVTTVPSAGPKRMPPMRPLWPVSRACTDILPGVTWPVGDSAPPRGVIMPTMRCSSKGDVMGNCWSHIIIDRSISVR
mmetsp:Transcript_20973/g.60584  ORF Transcript_20973/g.60584 Transcript_20973/m.60584 type:complete len:307 (+) Transcript_20973:279-1199(+)